jgi:hypothetical protein
MAVLGSRPPANEGFISSWDRTKLHELRVSLVLVIVADLRAAEAEGQLHGHQVRSLPGPFPTEERRGSRMVRRSHSRRSRPKRRAVPDRCRIASFIRTDGSGRIDIVRAALPASFYVFRRDTSRFASPNARRC